MKYANSIYYNAKYPYLTTIADAPVFSIVGRCHKGSRHYSENMNYEKALATMPKYVSVVEYFGGGTVELIDYNGNIIKLKRV